MNVGYRLVEVEDAVQGASIAVHWLYPTRAPGRPERFGPFPMDLATAAPPEGVALPLVVVSHGTGSTPYLHRDLGAHLARAGFVVALLQHPGNHRGDDRLAGTAINLQNRARHVRLAIDAAFADAALGPHLSHGGVGVIGHSLGGATALAIAGGKPWAAAFQTPDGEPAPLVVDHDGRVRALVLLAPATMAFLPEGALADLEWPILMRTGEKDVHAGPEHGALVERGLRDRARLDHEVVPDAGHFAFVSAYPAAMKSPAIPPSQDPEGFDRAAYLPVLFGEIETFLTRALAATAPSASG